MPALGKIARLPRHLRDEVSQRLDDGIPQEEVAKWVNTLPEVQAILKARFKGEAVSRSNVAHWVAHGHKKWLAHQERREFVRDIAHWCREYEEDGGTKLTEGMTAAAAGYLLAAIEQAAKLKDKSRLMALIESMQRVRDRDHAVHRLKQGAERLRLVEQAQADRREEARERRQGKQPGKGADGLPAETIRRIEKDLHIL